MRGVSLEWANLGDCEKRRVSCWRMSLWSEGEVVVEVEGEARTFW